MNMVHPADRFVHLFEDGLEVTAMRGRFLQSYPLFEWGDKGERDLGEVHWFIDPIVREALRRKPEKQRAGEEIEKDVRDDETLLEHLVESRTVRPVAHMGRERERADGRTDGKMLKDETLNILLAGRDTTVCTLTFSAFTVAEHPAMLERLRKEMLDVVGPTRPPPYEDIREMKYMRAFINEVFPAQAQASPRHGAYAYCDTALSLDPEQFIDERVQKYLRLSSAIPQRITPLTRFSLLTVRVTQHIVHASPRRPPSALFDNHLRQDAHPASMAPPGVEGNPYGVDGLEHV
ncbi:cytochrome P450 [Ganoderma leucocontextum]|nr:cytochrome P450 [Ganoderma leucocontextum]